MYFKKNKNLFRWILILISVLLIAIFIYGTYLYRKAQEIALDSYENVDREHNKSNLRNTAINPLEDNVSILIIGVDNSKDRNYKHSRSDALILATFNKELNSIKLLSIPRDTYVYVPELGYHTKINHAHYYGGPKYTIETVEKFLNVPIDYYISFNFEAFIEIVDSIGGIHYEVPYEIYEPDSHDNKNAIHLLPGYQELNGEEALALARTRKYDTDVQRGMRQQDIIKTIVYEAASASNVFKLDDMLEAIGNNMTTSLTFNEMKAIVSYGLSKELKITSINLDGKGDYLDDGLWYYQVDPESREKAEDELRLQLGL